MEQSPPTNHYISALTGIDYVRPVKRSTYKVSYPERRKNARFKAAREDFKKHLNSLGFTDFEIQKVYERL